jgi:hypothetical protein
MLMTRGPMTMLSVIMGLTMAGAIRDAEGAGTWTFWRTGRNTVSASAYTPLATHPHPHRKGWTMTQPGIRPYVECPGAEAGVTRLRVWAEGDSNTEHGEGDLIAGWRCPSNGSWAVSVTVRNPGSTVRGGDGGGLQVSVLGADDAWDTRYVERTTISSSSDTTAVTRVNAVLALEAGEHLMLRFNARQDGYGDLFEVRARMAPTSQPGRTVPSRGLDALLADPPSVDDAVAGPRMRPNVFWVGSHGPWAVSEHARDSIDHIRRFVPDIAVVLSTAFPETLERPAFYREYGIPTIAQNYGNPYVPYYLASKAFEIDWRGRVLDTQGKKGTWYGLWGQGHAVAKPSQAFHTAWRRLAQSAMRTGNGGVGFCDMVWFWAAGRGRTGYHPETIAAFREDLQGRDEGLMVHQGNGRFEMVKLADYAGYYVGGMPSPEDVGCASWAEYTPITHAQYTNAPPDDITPHFMLFDVLCHYEWLKAAQYIGRIAREEGGMFQCMGNPEDMANGVDTFFASRLRDVGAVSEEYFKSPQYLDGAYHRYPYLTSLKHDALWPGLVLEGGHGGNAMPYYDNALAYAIAYELSLAVQAEHVEGDFWPSHAKPLDALRRIEHIRLRCQQILAYGLGYRHALEDRAKRIAPAFVSVTSRKIFRPWGTAWDPWSHMWENLDTTPDPALVHAGFNFTCMGEDGLARLDAQHDVLIYTADPPTQQGFDRLLARVRSGRIGTAILSAAALSNVVTHTMHLRPLSALYPTFAFSLGTNAMWRGTLNDAAVRDDTEPESIVIHGPLYGLDGADTVLTLGERPIAVSVPEGKGRLNILLFDAARDENRSAAQAVYGRLLADHGITPRWRADPGTVARLYTQGDLLIAGIHNASARDWNRIIDRPDNKGHYVPYTAPDAASRVRLRLEPEARYGWAMLPRGTTGTVQADAEGWIRLGFDGTSHEIVFLLPEREGDRERLDGILARRDILDEALRSMEPQSVP